MVAKKKITVPGWLVEDEFLTLILSHTTTKYEYFASRAQIYSEKYGTDYKSFRKEIGEATKESFSEWDDLMAWEAFEVAAEEWKTRSEELRACMTL